MRLATLLTVIFLSLFGIPSAEAQINTDFAGPNGKIELNPPFPQPGDVVTASLNDYGLGASGATISWELNGQLVPDATNARETSITAGEVGSQTNITARLQLTDGTIHVLNTVIEPYYLDIIIEPQTRTPATYSGRALPSQGSSVNATAILSADTVLNGDYIYTWSLNQRVVGKGSIRGNNQVNFEMPRGSRSTLSVTVSRATGEVLAQRFISIPSVKPELYFYEVHPLYGTISRALSRSYNLIGNSVVLSAEPYYLDSRVFNEPDIKDWEIGGEKTNTFGNPYEITVQTVGESGSETVSFHVRSLSEILQGAEKSLTIRY